jgi:replicative DNA helicase
MRDVVDLLGQTQEGYLAGLPTGFGLLDRTLGGLQKSDLIYVAGRPGMGKSAWALSVGLHAAKHGSRVAVFSLEMSKEQLVQRLLSMETMIESHRIRTRRIADEEWNIVLECANAISNLPIYIDDSSGVSVDYVRRETRRMYAEHGLDLIIIDYTQLMSGEAGKAGNREQEISYISRNMKNMAKELNVPVIALSQLSRAVESRSDKRPILSDLRESGSQEQDADIVLFLYRDDYYNEDTDRQNIAEVIIAKHRHGATGSVSLFFRKELTLFRDLEIHREELYQAPPKKAKKTKKRR